MAVAIDNDGEAVRELRLEGALLWFAGGVLIAALVGAFALGHWMGSSGAPVSGGAAPKAVGNSEPTDVPAEDLSFFDTLGAKGQQAEPNRQASQPATTSEPAPIAQTPSPGAWFVQIGALRDRQAAEAAVRALAAKGYRLRVDTEREGARGVLYKVRVGGYPTRPAADTAAAALKAEGQGGAFVIRVD